MMKCALILPTESQFLLGGNSSTRRKSTISSENLFTCVSQKVVAENRTSDSKGDWLRNWAIEAPINIIAIFFYNSSKSWPIIDRINFKPRRAREYTNCSPQHSRWEISKFNRI